MVEVAKEAAVHILVVDDDPEKMAADPALKALPVIMISSIDSTRYKEFLPDDLHIPADAWIGKPVQPEHLLNTIRRFIK